MAIGLGASIIAWAGGTTAAAVTAGTLGTIAAGALGGAIIGAAIGGIMAAVTGGDIGKGILYGAVGGAVVGGLSGALAGGGSLASNTVTAVPAGAEGATFSTSLAPIEGTTQIALGSGSGGAGGILSGGAGGIGMGEMLAITAVSSGLSGVAENQAAKEVAASQAASQDKTIAAQQAMQTEELTSLEKRAAMAASSANNFFLDSKKDLYAYQSGIDQEAYRDKLAAEDEAEGGQLTSIAEGIMSTEGIG